MLGFRRECNEATVVALCPVFMQFLEMCGAYMLAGCLCLTIETSLGNVLVSGGHCVLCVAISAHMGVVLQLRQGVLL